MTELSWKERLRDVHLALLVARLKILPKKKKKNLSSALETKIVCQATQNKRVA